MARIGAYFRDKQLQKALSIVVLPGQATGKVDDVLDILHLVEANNRLVQIGTLADAKTTSQNGGQPSFWQVHIQC